MNDIEIVLDNKPGTLALMGETLGANKISLEGGGVFQNGATSIAHFLVQEANGFSTVTINEVVVQKLRQDVPGQLGLFCRRLADAGVNILVQYSDHAHQLVIVPDDLEKAKKVSAAWMKEWW